jgi:hypothetical protein
VPTRERACPKTLTSSAPGRRGSLGQEYKVVNSSPRRSALANMSSFVQQNFQPQQKSPRRGLLEIPDTVYTQLESPEASGDEDSLTEPNLPTRREHNDGLMLLEPFPSPTRRKFRV